MEVMNRFKRLDLVRISEGLWTEVLALYRAALRTIKARKGNGQMLISVVVTPKDPHILGKQVHAVFQ